MKEALERRPPTLRESGADFNHQIERALLVPDVLAGQQVGYPLPIEHELVFIPPRR